MKIRDNMKTYTVDFFGEYSGCYDTRAYNEKKALNNACSQLAKDVGEPVALVRWMVNEDKIDYEIRRNKE